MHLCDSWRWFALEGELCALSDLQATFTMNGVLLTITADIKTPTSARIISHYCVAMRNPCLCWSSPKQRMLARGSCSCVGIPTFGSIMATLFEPGSSNCWGSQNQIKNRSFGAGNTPTWSLTLSLSNFRRNYAPRGLSGTRKMRPGNGPRPSTCRIVA